MCVARACSPRAWCRCSGGDDAVRQEGLPQGAGQPRRHRRDPVPADGGGPALARRRLQQGADPRQSVHVPRRRRQQRLRDGVRARPRSRHLRTALQLHDRHEGRQRRSVVGVGVGGRAAGRTPALVSGGRRRGCGW